MYRTFFNSTLPRNELRAINRLAPEGIKYCNGFCQDYRSLKEFTGTNSTIKHMCRTCRNILNLGKKFIGNNQITLEQFKKNPKIVYGENNEILTTRECQSCKEIKELSHFEPKRKVCKSCRAIQSTNRNNKDIRR